MPTSDIEHSKPEIETWVTSDFVMGRFDPSVHKDFVSIDSFSDRPGLFLHKEAYLSFVEMYHAAEREGIKLIIKSATRNFEYQKGIWERKWSGETQLSDGTFASSISDPKERALKILLYSSMPGTSRHHWGTDLDINSFTNSYFEKGEGASLYEWMNNNAATFGFCQPYTDKALGRTGYEEEKWHWSYMPLSKQLTQFCRTKMSNSQIKGFSGSSVADDVDMLNNYILGINPNCL